MRLIKQKMCMVDPAFRMAVALAFTFCTGYAQSSDPRDQANRLRDAFSVAPPEISADGLIRPSSKSELFRAGERTEMLETAFGMANRARLPGRAIPAVTAAFNTDSDAGVAVSVSQLGLDRASLLAKGIAVLGETDPRAARIRLLASLSNLRPEYSCADAIVYSNAPLFAEASKLTLRGFSPDERRKRKDRDFALEIVRSATSPIDIRGTLLFIAALESWPSRERTDLEDMLWANTGGMRGNYRASGGSLVDGLASHLANNIESTGAGVALRMFLDAQVRANPCVEGSNPKSGESKRVLSIVEWFEAKLRPRFPGLQEVTYPTSFDGDIGPAAIVRKYWSPPESRELLLLMKRLRFGDAQQQRVLAALPLRADGRAPFLSDNDRGSAEWIAQAKEAMGRSEKWYTSGSESEPAQDRFNEVCSSFGTLSELAPGTPRNAVVTEWVAFLSGNPAEQEFAADWAFHVDGLLRSRGQTDEHRRETRRIVYERGDALMNSLADLEQLSPQKP